MIPEIEELPNRVHGDRVGHGLPLSHARPPPEASRDLEDGGSSPSHVAPQKQREYGSGEQANDDHQRFAERELTTTIDAMPMRKQEMGR
jgi:hypothetical protein